LLIRRWEIVIYLLWSYLPSPFLHALGIYYYPNRWWSLAIPSFLVMSLIYIYVALAAYNTEYLTLPIESIENIVDEVASVAVLHGGGGKGGSGRGKGKEKGKGKGKGERWKGGGRKEEKVCWSEFWGKGTDAVLDVPVGGVCEVLYGEGREGGIESGEDGGFTWER
jgi:phosphatidylinositol N-acetylglucosaminyltransferase subunit P